MFQTEANTTIANPKADGAEEVPDGFPLAGGSFQDELGDLWNLGARKKAGKRKKVKDAKPYTIPGGRKKKRAKLERLENWGKTEVEAEADVRSWLLKTETPVASRKMRQMEMEFKMVGMVKEQKKEISSPTEVGQTHMSAEVTLKPTPKPSPTTNQESKTEETTPKQNCGTPTPNPGLTKKQGGKKLPKKESMELIKKTNKKITGSIKPKPVIVIMENDWSDDIAIPAGIDPRDIERKDNAKIMAEGWKRKKICRELVMEIVTSAESTCIISHIMNMVMKRAWREVKENTVRQWLQEDNELIEFSTNLI